MTIGELLKAERTNANMNQWSFGEKLGIQQAQISKAECDKQPLKSMDWFYIADVFNSETAATTGFGLIFIETILEALKTEVIIEALKKLPKFKSYPDKKFA